MAANNFPPPREADLVTWTQNFDLKINAMLMTVGISGAQATNYHLLSAAFIAAYNVSSAPLTHSPANVSLKDASKHVLILNLRQLAGIVQTFPGMTNAVRIQLGLPQRYMPAPVPAPSTAPMIEVKKVSGRTASLRLIDVANPTKRGRPANASGASVFSYIAPPGTPGAVPPAELTAWTFEGNTGRTVVDIVFPPTLAAGATVWFTAYWFNPRKQAGPNTTPICANLPGGSVSMAA